MPEWMLTYAADYSDLGFDVEKHREAFRRFAELDISPISIRAILTARELLVFGYPGSRFRIGSQAESDRREQVPEGCLTIVPLHRTEDPAECERVRDDVARYFGRHFPGRRLEPIAMDPAAANAATVTIALFAPEGAV